MLSDRLDLLRLGTASGWGTRVFEGSGVAIVLAHMTDSIRGGSSKGVSYGLKADTSRGTRFGVDGTARDSIDTSVLVLDGGR